MEKIEAVIFDMDGLMFDTERVWLNSVLYISKEHNLNIPRQSLIDCVGLGSKESKKLILGVMGSDFDFDNYNKLAWIYMYDCLDKFGLECKKGLVQLLDFLKQNSIKIGIASSSFYQTILADIKYAKVSMDYFDSIIGGDMVKNTKPDPEIYFENCKKLGVNPKNALALEDSNYGALAAINAGIRTVCVPDLTTPTQEIKERAFAIKHDLLEVIDLIKKINDIE